MPQLKKTRLELWVSLNWEAGLEYCSKAYNNWAQIEVMLDLNYGLILVYIYICITHYCTYIWHQIIQKQWLNIHIYVHVLVQQQQLSYMIYNKSLIKIWEIKTKDLC